MWACVWSSTHPFLPNFLPRLDQWAQRWWEWCLGLSGFLTWAPPGLPRFWNGGNEPGRLKTLSQCGGNHILTRDPSLEHTAATGFSLVATVFILCGSSPDLSPVRSSNINFPVFSWLGKMNSLKWWSLFFLFKEKNPPPIWILQKKVWKKKKDVSIMEVCRVFAWNHVKDTL